MLTIVGRVRRGTRDGLIKSAYLRESLFVEHVHEDDLAVDEGRAHGAAEAPRSGPDARRQPALVVSGPGGGGPRGRLRAVRLLDAAGAGAARVALAGREVARQEAHLLGGGRRRQVVQPLLARALRLQRVSTRRSVRNNANSIAFAAKHRREATTENSALFECRLSSAYAFK